MPIDALCFYLESKHAYENYVMDCRWVGATGFYFRKTNEPRPSSEHTVEPTLLRWHEYWVRRTQVNDGQDENAVFDIIEEIAAGPPIQAVF